MRKKSGIFFVITGAALMLSALLLLLANGRQSRRAGEYSLRQLEELHAFVGQSAPADAPANPEPEQSLSPELPVVELDGYEYIGWLSIPSLELELPVMADWDYERLRLAPCRHFGSSRTDDLVIAAHNFESLFGSLAELEPGAAVSFTDMDGVENRYVLSHIERLLPEDTEAVLEGGSALVLYTCTRGAAYRIAAFCEREAASAPVSAADELAVERRGEAEAAGY